VHYPGLRRDAEDAVERFGKLEVTVPGVVENMRFATHGCGRLSHPFGRGEGAGLEGRAGVPLLAELPFEEPVAEGEDRGAPPMLEDPGGAVANASRSVAEGVLAGPGFVRAYARRATTTACFPPEVTCARTSVTSTLSPARRRRATKRGSSPASQ